MVLLCTVWPTLHAAASWLMPLRGPAWHGSDLFFCACRARCCCGCRPAKARCGSLAEDLQAKLARFDFPLNDKDNGGCRPIELPNGWPVVEYPIICDGVNALYEELFGLRRMLL